MFPPAWANALTLTEIDVNVSGANLDLEVPVRKLIDAFDLNQDPPIPAAVGDEIEATFTADPPKSYCRKVRLRNVDTEFVAEGNGTMVKPADPPSPPQ